MTAAYDGSAGNTNVALMIGPEHSTPTVLTLMPSRMMSVVGYSRLTGYILVLLFHLIIYLNTRIELITVKQSTVAWLVMAELGVIYVGTKTP